ncbi:MAG: hypothetical protein JRG93_11105 [Deltaproteobacteria bacterium]|nr:hypothetical protein [Deltaproteobacteria bacterium]
MKLSERLRPRKTESTIMEFHLKVKALLNQLDEQILQLEKDADIALAAATTKFTE